MAGTDIEIPLSSGESMPVYLARAENRSAAHGIVLLQEIFGINANLRATADDYAASGYDVIVPDLFWRQEPGVQLDPSTDRARATELMNGMDIAMAVQDAYSAAEYLRTLEPPTAKIGAVGYCLGGKVAYLLAMRRGIDAAASYYGVGIHGLLDRAAEVRCPLLLHIAADDPLCPPEAQAEIKRALANRPGVTILSYTGVGHAFARRGGATYVASAAEPAARATANFFERVLG
jgi:carboxymethylenebutenolidase